MAVYHVQASDMGEGYTEAEMTSYEAFIRRELVASGITDDVYVVERAKNFVPLYREDIRQCIDLAWDKWSASDYNQTVR